MEYCTELDTKTKSGESRRMHEEMGKKKVDGTKGGSERGRRGEIRSQRAAMQAKCQ